MGALRPLKWLTARWRAEKSSSKIQCLDLHPNPQTRYGLELDLKKYNMLFQLSKGDSTGFISMQPRGGQKSSDDYAYLGVA